jgi:hypothetical protein
MNPSVGRAVGRVLLTTLLLALLVQAAGPRLLQALMAPAKQVMDRVEPGLAVLRLPLQSRPSGQVLRAQVAMVAPLQVGEQRVIPHPRGRAHAQVPAAQVALAPALLLLLLVAWPARRRPEWAWRLLLAVPALLLLLALDTPLVLMAEVWGLLVDHYDPGSLTPLLAWSEFLRLGGRVLLAAALALAVVSLGRGFQGR